MSTEQLKQHLHDQAATVHAHLSITELAQRRADELAAVARPETKIDEDVRRSQAAIGIYNAILAKNYLQGDDTINGFHIEFFPGHPYDRETKTYHTIQLSAFEKLMGEAFRREVSYDEETGIYRPVYADSGREIVRSTLVVEGTIEAQRAEPNILRFADTDKHAYLISLEGQMALNSIAEA